MEKGDTTDAVILELQKEAADMQQRAHAAATAHDQSQLFRLLSTPFPDHRKGWADAYLRGVFKIFHKS